MSDVPTRIRCAIYTRKSSEEGLEQSFNSLHAQREACEAYVLSQQHEGWQLLSAHYDDGGFSGGNMERPGLKRMLEDIAAKRIDTVVVYKVDRLTRSLNDFARIVEQFDRQGISFVSVTQQFNTTTSMGRLTLNVLLSFAQFEREVTGERIRDKVAASKKKGMWMGGTVPMGYDLSEHSLVVNEVEAKQVREIFKQYLRLGSVFDLHEHLSQTDIRSKRRVSLTGAPGSSPGPALIRRGWRANAPQVLRQWRANAPQVLRQWRANAPQVLRQWPPKRPDIRTKKKGRGGGFALTLALYPC